MKPVTIRSDPMSVDCDMRGVITISRTDVAQSIQVSQTEWAWLMRAAELFGWPHTPVNYVDSVCPET